MTDQTPSARDRWMSSGLIAFRLPSGFIVSGVWPSVTDLVRRGLMPWRLRQAVQANSAKAADDITDEDVMRNLETRQRIAAAFLRGIYDDETGEWEQLRLTFQEMAEGMLPGNDLEALDDFAIIADRQGPERAALAVNLATEIGLGLQTIATKGADDTDEDMSTFRDDSAGAQPGDGSGAVLDTPESDDRHKRPVARARSRPRSGSASSP